MKLYQYCMYTPNSRHYCIIGDSDEIKLGFGWRHLGERQSFWKDGAIVVDLPGLDWEVQFSRNYGCRCGIDICIGDHEKRLKMYIGFPYLYSFYFSLGGQRTRWIPQAKFVYGKETGIKFHDGYLNISFNYDEGIYRPSGFQKLINIKNFVFGRQVVSLCDVEEKRVKIVLPEAEYPATVTLIRRERKYKRFLKPEVVFMVNVKPDNPIPAHAGKGENDWDMEDDYVYESCVRAKSITEGIKEFVWSIERDRKLYGDPTIGNAK